MKEIIINTIEDLVSNFLYYDRIEDEDLPEGEIEINITNGIITIDEIVNKFRFFLEHKLKNNSDYFEK